MLNIIIFGNCIFTVKIVKELIKNNNINVTLISYKNSPDYCIKKALPKFLNKNNFQYKDFNPKKDSELDFIGHKNYDLLFCCCWDRKLSEQLLSQLPCYNFHASLLPQYRGATPLQAQLKNHEKIGGVTLHLMTETFDAGPIYEKKCFYISKFETFDSIALKAAKKMKLLTRDFIRDYPDITVTEQEEEKATFC